jgi:hypothetical protein
VDCYEYRLATLHEAARKLPKRSPLRAILEDPDLQPLIIASDRPDEVILQEMMKQIDREIGVTEP